jgi:hypothetical protein
MGHSPTIEQQGQKDAAFQKYVDEQTTALNKKSGEAETTMTARMDKFYKQGGWEDAKPLTQGSYQHLTTASEWSLTHVSDMIDAIRGAIFGGAAAPSATDPNSKLTQIGKGTVTDTAPPALTAMAAMAGIDLLIASAAFDAIQGILTTFTSKTSTEIVSNYTQKDLVPGLSLFVTVMEDMYHRSDFFTGETIIQNFYIFDAKFSVSRGADIAKFHMLETLINQQVAIESQANKMSERIAALDVNRTDYEAAFEKLTQTLDMQNKYVEKLQAQIDALRKAKQAADTAQIEQLRQR